ncbi:MAG: hypothetical protein KJP04_04465, partial [Arenicella sp.]|nr:hypothetical protein [Arenicella sp.]
MATPIQIITKRIRQRAMGSGSVTSAVLTGLFAGAIMVITSISYASLIFSGDLQPYLGDGIVMGLTSVTIVAFMLAFFSSSAHLIPQIDDDTAPVFVLFIAL